MPVSERVQVASRSNEVVPKSRRFVAKSEGVARERVRLVSGRDDFTLRREIDVCERVGSICGSAIVTCRSEVGIAQRHVSIAHRETAWFRRPLKASEPEIASFE